MNKTAIVGAERAAALGAAQGPGVDYSDRRQYIGGSAIASIVNLQPKVWRTAVDLYERMTADHREEVSTTAQRKLYARGKIVEPLVAQLLALLYNVPSESIVHVSNQRHADPDVPYFAAEIDFELALGNVRHLFADDVGGSDDEIVNVEIKTVHPFAAKEWGEEGTDDVPIHYAAQVQWGLGVKRRRLALCAALFGADNLVLYPIVADAGVISTLREAAAKFWQRVQDREPPEPINIHDANTLWPDADGSGMIADESMLGNLRTLEQLRDTATSMKEGADGVGVLVRMAVKNATSVRYDGREIATVKNRGTSSIDADRLKAEFPDAYRACLRTGTTRVIVIKDLPKMRTEQ